MMSRLDPQNHYVMQYREKQRDQDSIGQDSKESQRLENNESMNNDYQSNDAHEEVGSQPKPEKRRRRAIQSQGRDQNQSQNISILTSNATDNLVQTKINWQTSLKIIHSKLRDQKAFKQQGKYSNQPTSKLHQPHYSLPKGTAVQSHSLPPPIIRNTNAFKVNSRKIENGMRSKPAVALTASSYTPTLTASTGFKPAARIPSKASTVPRRTPHVSNEGCHRTKYLLEDLSWVYRGDILRQEAQQDRKDEPSLYLTENERKQTSHQKSMCGKYKCLSCMLGKSVVHVHPSAFSSKEFRNHKK